MDIQGSEIYELLDWSSSCMGSYCFGQSAALTFQNRIGKCLKAHLEKGYIPDC